METRARYILIGAFSLGGALGLIGFVLWFASVEVDRRFAYYEIDFETVSGLSNASVVRFRGFPVGQVVGLELAPDNSGRIRTRIEIDAETPVRTSSVATVESQGVTGVGFVALTPGRPEDPLLADVSDAEFPDIPGERSTLQVLTEDAPRIVEETLAVARQLRELLGDENQANISGIFQNLNESSADLSQALEDFSSVTETIAESSEQIAAFSVRLERISESAIDVLETAEVTLSDISELVEQGQTTLEAGDEILASGRTALETTETYIAGDLSTLTRELTDTVGDMRGQVEQVVAEARGLIEEYQSVGVLAADRLVQAEATIATAETTIARMSETLAAVDDASRSVQTLVEGEGTALVTEMRAATTDARDLIARATVIAETDLPEIVADIRQAADSISVTVDEVGADLTEAAGRFGGLSDETETALMAATATFTRANITLKELNQAIESGDAAFRAADEAFGTADALLREDITAIAGDLRTSLDQLDTALAQVSDDLPGITASLRDTAERANDAIAQVESAVATTAGPLRDFATEGLPQFSQLAREARGLVDSLDRLVRNIERDPARYFLGQDEPVFRR